MYQKLKKVKRNLAKIEEWSKKTSARNITRPKDPEDLLKFELCNSTIHLMKKCELKREDVAVILEIPVEKVDAIVNLKFDVFAMEELLSILNKLAGISSDPLETSR